MNVVIQKWGNSNGIRIPKRILEKLNLKVNDKLEIKTEKNRIIIEKNEKSIVDLFNEYNGDYPNEFIDFGEKVGLEIW